MPYAARSTAQLVDDLVDRAVNTPTALVFELGRRAERGDFDGPARLPTEQEGSRERGWLPGLGRVDDGGSP
jgi:hypothetical protein